MFEVEFAVLGITAPWPLLVLIGFFAGSVAALFGVGGGIVATPALSILGAPMPIAVGTSVHIIAASACAATIGNRRHSLIQWRAGLVFALAMVPAVEISAAVMQQLQRQADPLWDWWLRAAFVVAVLLTTFVIARSREEDAGRTTFWHRIGWPPRIPLGDGRTLSVWVVIAAGVTAGFFAGFFGLGGGRIIVPVLLLVAGIGYHRSIATSSAIILASSCYAAATYGWKGLADYPAILCMLGGAVIGAALGALLMRRSETSGLKRWYYALTAAALGAMVLRQLALQEAALWLLMTVVAVILMGCALQVWRARASA